LVVAALLAGGSFSHSSVADEHSTCLIWEEGEISSPAVMEIRLTGDVGSDMANQLFQEIDDHLSTYPTLKTIKILLSSGGGYAESGFMIHNYLQGLHQRHALQVVTHNIGSVQSAAVDIYCAGNQRITSPYTFFMVHDASFDLTGGSYDVKSVRDLDEENAVTGEASHTLFSACTNLTLPDVGKMFSDQTYIDPDEALELGLAHSIQPATFDRTADIRCLIEAENEEGLEE
jgi:ATP-dependent protease ClpP protease subunit